jgi:hypothetical protein
MTLSAERNQRLYERFFGEAEGQEAEDTPGNAKAMAQFEEVIHDLEALVPNPAFKRFRTGLEMLLLQTDVRPGAERDMLYQIGRRDGLRDLLNLMIDMEDQLRQHRLANDPL